MRRLALATLPFILIGCSSPEVEITQPDYPVYCIRDVIFLGDEKDPDGRLLLDMPGYPHGQTDMMQEISRQTYDELEVDACKSDDPRMNLEPRGIAWTDGRNTDLDGNPLNE